MKKTCIYKVLAAAILCAVFLSSCALKSAEDNSGVSEVQNSISEMDEAEMAELMADILDDSAPVEDTADENGEAEGTSAPEAAQETDNTEEMPFDVSEEKSGTRLDDIDAVISSMTPEQKLAQMFIVSYEKGYSQSAAADYGFGGYILFADDFENETKESLRASMDELKAAYSVTPFIAVDEEGGTVTRISRFTQYRDAKFDSIRDVYASGGIEGIKADSAEKAELITSLGLNMNMAPDADISTNEYDFMYYRSLGLDPWTTSDVVKTIADVSAQYGMASVVKHFPGYGAVTDTHTGMAYDYRTLEELEAYDLIPFAEAMKNGICAVMVSHIVTALDWQRPASVSGATVEYIRTTMGYDGIIMTDDLAMNGILDFCTDGTSGCAALEAILAGYDMLCCTNWAEQYPTCLQALYDGTLTEARLEESVRRILTAKATVLK